MLVSGGIEINDDVEKANLLNHTFANKFSSSAASSFPEVPFSVDATLTEFSITEDAVRHSLQDLVVSKACGPDGVSARILRECANELAVRLCKLFRMSLRKGCFPEQWAEANIVPIFKKGSRKDPANYRSISLLPLCAKIFEKIVSDQLYQYVQPYLSTAQHGFIRNRSCTHRTWHASYLTVGRPCKKRLSLMQYIPIFRVRFRV